MPIEARFAQGQFRELVREIVDAPNSRVRSLLRARDWAFLVGALVFVGRRSDAEGVAHDEIPAQELEAWIIARFFLGLGASRDSLYEEARRFFGQNYTHWKTHGCSDELTFFVFQGFGFLRNLQSRFAKSSRWTERAWRHAFKARSSLGMLLALDLRGHNHVQRGEVARGLRCLADAREIAQELGQHGLGVALDANIAIYRAQHGWAADPEAELSGHLRNEKSLDTYSRSNIVCELARAQMGRGFVRRALKTLEDGTDEVFRWGHRRQRATFLSRRAYALMLSGDRSSALRVAQEGLALLDADVDLVPRLELLGLLASVNPTDRATHDEIVALTRLSGRRIARQILDRAQGQESVVGDDFLGRLHDRARHDSESIEVAVEVMASGWWGVFRRFREDAAGRDSAELLLELIPGRLVLFDRGEVRVSGDLVPAQVRSLLLALGRGPQSKQDLVESIWGYRYEAIRHDPMVYTAIHRVRRLLGDFEELLVAEEGVYRWCRPVRTTVFERREATKSDRIPAKVFPERASMNLRQLRVQEELRLLRSIDVATYSEKFAVSKPTAVRDLRELVENGFLKKVGRARATCYVLEDGP